MPIKKDYFNNIDFLRFIFSVFIVMFHCRNSMVIIPQFHYINVCVYYFFIIAGFFLFYTINTAQSTFQFAQKRFLRLVPLLWIFILCSFLMHILIGTSFSFDGQILRIFLLHNIGFGPAAGGLGSHISWFISVLFWVSIFYFYIAKIIDRKYLNLLIWLITICSLGLIFNYTHFNTNAHTTNIFYFINTGVLRGLGGMGIGYFISELYKTEFLQKTSKQAKVIISFIEIFICGFLLYYMLFAEKLPGKTGFVYLFVFSILFYLFLVQKGILSKLLNNKISSILGKYSYAIYVMHPIVMGAFNKIVYIKSNTFVTSHITLTYTIEVLLAVLLGIAVHYLFEKPINKFIWSKSN